MVKILFHGTQEKFRQQCKVCGCDFTFNLCDLTENGDRHFIWIKCPECGNMAIANDKRCSQ